MRRRLASILLALAMLSAPLAAANAQDAFTDDERAEIERIVRDYLLANPGLLEEMIELLEAEQATAQVDRQRQAIADNSDALFRSPRAAVVGDPDGDVTLVEFFDYNCPHCQRMTPEVAALIEADPELRLVLKQWPVLGGESVEAAEVAVAVSRAAPDSFYEFHTALMSESGRVDGERAMEIAEEMDLDIAAIEEGRGAPEVAETLQESLELGGALGLRGTPAYVIGDSVLAGAVGQRALEESVSELRETGCEVC